MIDLYLHAASEAAALDLLRPLGLVIGDAWISATPAFALDAGVPVQASPAVFDAAGELVAAATLEAGFHLNIRLPDGTLESAIRATGLVLDPPPATPARAWG